MRNNLRVVLGDKQIRRFTTVNFFLLVLFFIVTLWKWSSLPPQLPLFFSLPRSTEQLGTPVKLLILPFFAVAFSLVNLYLALIIYERERLLSVILTVMSTTANLLLLVTFIKIVFLVS